MQTIVTRPTMFHATKLNRQTGPCQPIGRVLPGSPVHRSVVATASGSITGPSIQQRIAVGVLGVASSMLVSGSALADREKIGEFSGSGFLFKDSVEVVAIDDPDVAGVTLYISDFKRSITDKLANDFFSEPSTTSLTCAITGDVVFKNGADRATKDGKDIYSESKGLNIFQDKTQRVRRIYDTKRQSLVYVAYSTRLTSAAAEKNVSGGRYKTSVCVVPLSSAPSVTIEAKK